MARLFSIPTSLLSSVLLSLSLLALARPQLSPTVLHEKRGHLPGGWSHARKHDQSSILPLRFGLTQSNIDDIEKLLNDVSHPDSPNYGNHWTPAQVAKTFAPSDETVDTVLEWLAASGFGPDRSKVTPAKSWIEVNMTVEEAERLLHTEYHVYAHESGQEHIACNSYHLPSHVTPHVDLITPSVHFDAILNKRSPGSAPARNIGLPGPGTGPKTTGQVSEILANPQNCDKQITPACLRALYGFEYTPVAANKNSYGIVEYTPQAYLQSDLNMFATMFSPDEISIGRSPKLVSIDGGVVQDKTKSFNLNGESDLDLQYAMNLVTSRQDVTLYQVGDLQEGASFNNFLDALDGSYCKFEGGDDPVQDATYPDPLQGGYKGQSDCGTVKPANVISTSYGYNEADLTPAYTARQCREYAKLGLMGVTVLYSSGDNGVAGNGGLCLNPNGTQTASGKIFNPSFPGTCPFVTSVGATQINPGASVTDPEGACEQVIYSGGGWSNQFPIPDYQKNAVATYLKTHKPTYPSTIWNSTGVSRAYPDLSANGANYVVAVDGKFNLIFGTSASSPVVGAILTMINDARLAKGKKPIGFINPTIYSDSFAGAFHDITMGGNQGCGTAGFQSTPGWDPVTGLGTPSFPQLLKKWLSLP